MTIPERDIIRSLAKGLAVIETFTADRPRQSITEAAEATGLDRATTRRCLLTLADSGYADYDGKYFTLTPRVLRLGSACLATMPLPSIVQPVLDKLSERIRESSSVSILDGNEIVYIARAAHKKVISISLMPGSRLPAYCSSMGRVLLAALPEDEARAIIGSAPLPARTARTITCPEAIMAELCVIRSQGYALIDQEIEEGLRSLAVPITNAFGKTVSAMNVGLSATIKMEEIAPIFLNELLSEAEYLKMLIR